MPIPCAFARYFPCAVAQSFDCCLVQQVALLLHSQAPCRVIRPGVVAAIPLCFRTVFALCCSPVISFWGTSVIPFELLLHTSIWHSHFPVVQYCGFLASAVRCRVMVIFLLFGTTVSPLLWYPWAQ